MCENSEGSTVCGCLNLRHNERWIYASQNCREIFSENFQFSKCSSARCGCQWRRSLQRVAPKNYSPFHRKSQRRRNLFLIQDFQLSRKLVERTICCRTSGEFYKISCFVCFKMRWYPVVLFTIELRTKLTQYISFSHRCKNISKQNLICSGTISFCRIMCKTLWTAAYNATKRESSVQMFLRYSLVSWRRLLVRW